MLAVLGLLLPAGLGAQEEEPRCFVVSSVDARSDGLGRLEGEILRLTREPYSRGLRGVVWWQAFLGRSAPEAEALPWRELSSDTIEVQLGRLNPSQLMVEDSGGTLRGYIRLYSDEVGRPPGRYSFVAEEVSCGGTNKG